MAKLCNNRKTRREIRENIANITPVNNSLEALTEHTQ